MGDTSAKTYAMGDGAEELQRLEAQGKFLRPATRSLFLKAGIGAGQTVLDFGCGAGDVSLLVGELVGAQGRVIGVDLSAQALTLARTRAERHGATNLRFVQGDESLVGTPALAEGSADAVVGRLVMMHQRDMASTLRQLAGALRPGGVMVLQELHLFTDPPACPRLPLFERVWGWLQAGAKALSVDLQVGMKLPGLCRAVGLTDIEAEWVGSLSPASDPITFELLAGLMRGFVPLLVRNGVATAEAIGIETLAARMQAEALAANATVAYMTSVGVWARKR